MERTELMVLEGANCIRAGRLSRNKQDGKSWRVPDDRMLWNGNALIRFAPFPTINSVLSNAAELRLQTFNVVGLPMEKRPPMTESDVASEHPNLNEGCEPPQGVMTRTPQARGPTVVEFKYGTPTELQRPGVTGV
jgi:hypothetical protein